MLLRLLIAVTIFLTACSDRASAPKAPPLDPQLQARLVEAVSARDVQAVQRLLDEGAIPDKATGNAKAPLVVALEVLETTKGQWKFGESQMRVLQLLAKKVRLRDRPQGEMIGALKVSLQQNPSGVGMTVDTLTLTSSDGKTQPVAIAFEETTFVGVPGGGTFMFPVEFSRKYGLRGSLHQGVFEVEEIRYADDAPPQDSTAAKAGIVIPISPLLPSTGEYLRPMLEKGK